MPPATTSTHDLLANFTWTPNPCTIDIPGTNCMVDGSVSTGNIVQYHWAYAGKDVFDVIAFQLQFACNNLVGGGTNRTLNVRLTVIDNTGAASTFDQGVPVTVLNAVCP